MSIVFLLFWIALNGRVTMEILLFGIAISAGATWLLWRLLDYKPRYDWLLIKSLPIALCYVLVLVREVILATLCMAGFIFNHRDIPEPVLVSFTAPLKTELARTILADSITLTPGTITVDMHEGEFQVHCYDKSLALGIDESVFVRLLRKWEESL